MRLFPVVFYDDNADAGAGGGAADTSSQQQQVNTNVDLTKPLFTETELKDFGFDNPDQLKEHLRQFKENSVPDEEKKKKEEVEKANFIKYSTEADLMTVEDYTKYESLNKKADRDLVFESYLPAWKEENPDVDAADIERLAKADFEDEYKLDSKNEKTKARGEARLSKEAKDLKAPVESKFTNAKKGYDDLKSMKAAYPEFKKFLTDLITGLTPETLNIAKVQDKNDKGEVVAEVEIPVELTKEERAEISKIFENQKTFVSFLDSKGKAAEKLAPALKNKINSFLKVKHFDTVVNKSFAAGKGIGIKNGSTAGAENSFGLQPDKGNQGSEATPDIQKQIRDSLNKAAARQR